VGGAFPESACFWAGLLSGGVSDPLPGFDLPLMKKEVELTVMPGLPAFE